MKKAGRRVGAWITLEMKPPPPLDLMRLCQIETLREQRGRPSGFPLSGWSLCPHKDAPLCCLAHSGQRVERRWVFYCNVCPHMGNHRVLKVADILRPLEQLDLNVGPDTNQQVCEVARDDCAFISAAAPINRDLRRCQHWDA
jgi:hypothetical protein